MELVQPSETRPLGRPRYRWEDNIRMDLKKKLFVSAVMNLMVPQPMKLVKPSETRPLGRPRYSWDYNIRTYLKEMIVNAVLNLQIP